MTGYEIALGFIASVVALLSYSYALFRNKKATQMKSVLHPTKSETSQSDVSRTAIRKAFDNINNLSSIAQNTRITAIKFSEIIKETYFLNPDKIQTATTTKSQIGKIVKQVESISNNVHRLSDHTKNIESILGLLKDVAEQTNLLALNAAIEAARSGENGRGFAVVADEVRTLAMRTQNSTQEIEKLISNLQEEANYICQEMDTARQQSSHSFEEIESFINLFEIASKAMSDMSSLNYQILNASEKQAKTMEQLNANMATIEQEIISITGSNNSR